MYTYFSPRKCRREYNIKMDMVEIRFEDLNSIELTRDRVAWRML
jgi:hypothetical protein